MQQPPNDYQDRLNAAIPSEHNIIVEAGAGTGKTTLLIDRLCYLILGKGIPIDKIIALTFTDKAAAEIKIRLLAKMQQIIKNIELEQVTDPTSLILLNEFKKSKEELQKSVQSSFELAERAQISTIHSFCLQVLRKYPLEAGLAPKAQADDGTFMQSIFDKKWDNFLEDQLTFDSPAHQTWEELLSFFTLDELKDFAFSLLNPALENYHPFAAEAEVKKCCADFSLEAQRLSSAYPSAKKRDIELSLEQAAKYLADAAEKTGQELKEPLWPDIKIPSGKAPKNWPDDDFKRAKEIISFANDIIPQKQMLIFKAFNLLSGLKAEVLADAEKENIVSYDELIYKTKNLLRRDKTVREELKKEYRSILIDEFQDTDPAQGEILLFLSEKQGLLAQNWDEVILESGKLFVVGDPKQSIYSFRGADINAYEKFTDLMLKQGAIKCFLKTNFRSLPQIINFANAFGAKAITERKGIQPKYIPIEAGRTQNGPKVQIACVQNAEVKAGIDAYRQNQAQYIAAWVKDNVGKTKLADGSALRLKDIAILLRSTTALDAYTDALKRFDIKYTVEETKNFYAAQEVSDLINLLALMNDISDKAALLGVLRSPFALLKDADILKLSQRKALNIFAEVKDMPRAEAVYKMLRELHFKAGRLPPEDFINELIYHTDFVTLESLASGTEQTAANIFKLASVVRKMHERGALNLGQFLFYARKYSQEQNKEGESPLSEESLDTLTVMTMHKSKGLEYPVVILTDISKKDTDRADKKPLYISSWSSKLCGARIGALRDGNFLMLEQSSKERADAEELRILYVALTRAKEQLILAGDLKDEPSSLAGALQKADCYPSEDLHPTELEGAEIKYLPLISPEQLESKTLYSAYSSPQTDLKGWREAWQKRCELYQKLTQTPAALAPSQSNAEDYSSEGGAALTGKLCHKMIYDIFTSGRANARKAALIFGEDPKECAEQIKEAEKIIAQFCASDLFKQLKSLKLLAAEMPFSMKTEDGTVNGIMDAVFEKPTGEIFIADYKSDNIKEEEAAQRTAFYSQQLTFYKNAAKKIFETENAEAAVIYLRPALMQKI